MDAFERLRPSEPKVTKGGHIVAQPWHEGDFMRRLATFKASTWGLAEVDPTECVCHGWMNDAPNRLRCESCLAGWILKPTDDQQLIKEQLKALHRNDCSWKSLQCKRDQIYRIPLKTRDETVKYVKSMAHELQKLDLEAFTIADIETLAPSSEILSEFGVTDAKIALLIFNGWQARRFGKADLLECPMCFRCVGTWNFRSDTPKRINTDARFHPVAEHRVYCLYRNFASCLEEIIRPCRSEFRP